MCLSPHLLLPGKAVVLRQKQHAVALVPFPHGDAGAVPVPVLGLRLLVLVETAGAEGGAQIDLVLGEALDDDGGNGHVDAQFRVGVLQVRVGEGGHGLGGLPQGGLPFLRSHPVALQVEQ